MKVVKIGGAMGTDRSHLVNDIGNCEEELILVHGGSDEMDNISSKLGKPPTTITSPSGHVSRYTDEETMDILKMAYPGLVNKSLVEDLREKGINAIGLSGLDGGLLVGRRKKAIRSVENGKVKVIRDDNSGKVDRVNISLLRLLMENGYLPVITVPISSENGRALNADADRVAASIACAIEADELVLLTNQPGLLKSIDDPKSLVATVPRSRIDDAMDLARGRMKKKVLAAREAIEGGVNRVIIASANVDNPVRSAIQGKGTVIS